MSDFINIYNEDKKPSRVPTYLELCDGINKAIDNFKSNNEGQLVDDITLELRDDCFLLYCYNDNGYKWISVFDYEEHPARVLLNNTLWLNGAKVFTPQNPPIHLPEPKKEKEEK